MAIPFDGGRGVQRNPAPTQLIERNGKTVARRLQKIRVTVVDGPDRGAVFEGAQDEIRVGCAEDNDLMVRDPAVSRRHVALRLAGDGIRVVDLGSTNGTFMGDVRVHDVVVPGPQDLLLGSTRVRVEPLGQAIENEMSAGMKFGRMVGTSPAMRSSTANTSLGNSPPERLPRPATRRSRSRVSHDSRRPASISIGRSTLSYCSRPPR